MSRRAMLHCSVSQAAVSAGVAMAMSVGIQTAQAQTPVQVAPPATVIQATPSLTLPTMDVSGQADPPNTLQRPTGISRLPGTVQDTPQTINVIPRALMEQQGVTSVEQALRNVPGITTSIGEGNGGVNGDSFRIRGFSSQNDVYVDGLRDFGSYTRDAFNLESVSVLKGPSGTTFGQNTVGGAINLQTRTPHLGNAYSGTLTTGMGPMGRGTFDINRQIGETSAVRLNIMGNHTELVDRDRVSSGRWGIAPSFAVGLGTATTFTLDYLHMEDRRVPDFGMPTVTAPGQTMARPVTDYGVNRRTWYGWGLDRDDTTVDRVTARLQHQATDWLTVYNDTRVGFVNRRFATSVVSCGAPTAAAPTTPNCSNALFDNNPRTVPMVQAGGAGNPFEQQTWGVQNVTTAVARFTTGPVRHEATAGLDVWYQNDQRTGFGLNPATRPTVSLFTGYYSDAGYSVIPGTGANVRETDQRYIGGFATNRMWLTPQISVVGGVRVSNYDIDYKTYGQGAAATVLSSNQTFVDPRAALIFEPTPQQSYYFSYGRSTSPAGSFITTQPGSFSAANQSLDPERNTVYELGAKFSLLNNRLGLYGALFRIEKEGAYVTDPLLGTTTQSGDDQRNQGVEIGVTGQITDTWAINANYTYMDSETTRSSTAANVGRRVQFVPRHAAAMWTTYDAFKDTPYNVQVGGGFTWRSQVYLNNTNTAEVGANFSLDAVLSHRFGSRNQWRVAVNGYNLTNELNFDQLWANRVVPSSGRTVLFSLSAAY